MAITFDCGEGKHDLCTGRGRAAYMFPQESRYLHEPPFNCGCPCHHDGRGVPCRAPGCQENTTGQTTTDLATSGSTQEGER